jgi:hypothetical protein
MKHGVTAATRTMFLTALLCVRAHRSVKIQTLGFARTSVLDDENGIPRFLEGYDVLGPASFTCYIVLANGVSPFVLVERHHPGEALEPGQLEPKKTV